MIVMYTDCENRQKILLLFLGPSIVRISFTCGRNISVHGRNIAMTFIVMISVKYVFVFLISVTCFDRGMYD